MFVHVFRCGCKLLRPERSAEGSVSVFVEASDRPSLPSRKPKTNEERWGRSAPRVGCETELVNVWLVLPRTIVERFQSNECLKLLAFKLV